MKSHITILTPQLWLLKSIRKPAIPRPKVESAKGRKGYNRSQTRKAERYYE